MRDLDIELEDGMVEDLLVELQGHICPLSDQYEFAGEDGINSFMVTKSNTSEFQENE